jgi:hypothetical protein
MSRVNARIDEHTEARIAWLTEVTGQSVSHVVRESVARYHAEVQARQAGPRRLLALAGQGDSGRDDIASDAKRFLGAAIETKLAVALAASQERQPAAHAQTGTAPPP